MRNVLRGLRPATVLPWALVAILAATGTATAAKLITGRSVKDASLTGRDVRNSSLTGEDIKNGSLTRADFKGSVLPQGAQGTPGPQGAQGPQGPRGTQGEPGTSGLEVVSETFTEVFVVNSGGQRGLSAVKTVSCPEGKSAVSGGYDLGTNATQNGQARQVTVSSSEPKAGGAGWSVQLFNNSTSFDTSIDLEVTAVCAKVG